MASWYGNFPISFTTQPVLVGAGVWINAVASQQTSVTITGFSTWCTLRECRLNGTWIAIGY